jgi:iron(III) transport system permease protein
MMQVGRELEEAGSCGCDVWQRFRRIIFHSQVAVSSPVSADFITTMRELSLIILLVTPQTQVLASQTMFYIENGDGQMANIVILILIGLTLIGNTIIGRFRGGSPVAGM